MRRASVFLYKKQVRTGYITLLTCFIFYSSSFSYTPRDTLRQFISRRLDHVTEKYYYTNADSAFYHLSSLGRLAQKNNHHDLYLDILINEASIAEHHRLLDSLQHFLDVGQSVLQKNDYQLRKYDSYTRLRDDLNYMKGMYHFIIGDLTSALSDFKETVFTNDKLTTTDSLYTFDALINIAQLYSSLQDHTQSLYYYAMARQVLPKQHKAYLNSVRDYNYQCAFFDIASAKVQFQLQKSEEHERNYNEITASYNRALHLLRGKESKAEAQNLYLMVYQNMAEVYRAKLKPDSALYWIKRSLMILTEGDSERRIKTLMLAGSIHREAGSITESKKYFQRGMREAEQTYHGKHLYKAQLLYELGFLESKNKNWPIACHYFQLAIQQLTDYPLETETLTPPSLSHITAPFELLKILSAKGDALYAWHLTKPNDLKKLTAAITNFELAMTYGDTLKQMFLQESQLTFFSTQYSLYEKSIEASTRAYDAGMGASFLEKAFSFMEKSKASTLLQTTRKLSASITSVPAVITKQENSLRGKLYYWQRELTQSTDATTLQEARKQILQSYEAYQKLLAQIKKNYPAYFELLYNTKTLSYKEAQKHILSQNNALIEYFYGEKNLYIFLVTKETTDLKKISIDKKFNMHLSRVLDYVRNSPLTKTHDSDIGQTSAKALYQTLIEPISKYLKGITKLVIIPDRALGYLPFEILAQKEPGKMHQSTSTPSYLFKKFIIRYESSATLAYEKKKHTERSAALTYVGFAPDYKNPSPSSTRTMNTMFHQVPPLQFNKKEIQNAEHFFNNDKTFYNTDATETSFKKYSSQSRIIHLSMHALLNTQNPLYSGLLFSDYQKKKSSMEDDGFLYLYELYNMKLHAELAVLSACETGSGELTSGEGIISIGRAFQYAGCPAVAMSLWQVNDRSTSKLMSNFLENISKGMEKDEALQVAKLSFLNDPKNKAFSHPHYWSAFILTGNETPIQQHFLATKNITRLAGGMFVVTILIFLLWIYNWKRRAPH